MAHSHTKTQLAALGFRDPDKKEPRHDWACQYLASTTVFGKMLGAMLKAVDPDNPVGFKIAKFGIRPRLEHILTKGQGRYKTTIGYLDMYPRLYLEGQLGERTIELAWDLLVEVKIKGVPVGDILRQLALYREYLPQNNWLDGYYWDDDDVRHVCPLQKRIIQSGMAWTLLVTDYPLDKTDVQTLRTKGIGHVRLGQGFEDYVTQRKKAEPATSVAI